MCVPLTRKPAKRVKPFYAHMYHINGGIIRKDFDYSLIIFRLLWICKSAPEMCIVWTNEIGINFYCSRKSSGYSESIGLLHTHTHKGKQITSTLYFDFEFITSACLMRNAPVLLPIVELYTYITYYKPRCCTFTDGRGITTHITYWMRFADNITHE